MSQESPGPSIENPYLSPVAAPSAAPIEGQPVDQQGDGTGGLIPYKNPSALIAYYLGLFSFFPVLGIGLAIPAVVLGILGLRARKKNPAIKGTVHAWIGILCGTFCTLLWGLMIVGLILAAVSA